MKSTEAELIALLISLAATNLMALGKISRGEQITDEDLALEPMNATLDRIKTERGIG